MRDVRLDHVSVSIGGVPVLHDVSAEIPDGAFAAVIGPSGSGKSTLLRALAGLEKCAAGTVRLGGADVTDAAPRDRDVGMVFQMPAILPHRNVRGNIAFPLEIRRQTREAIRQRVDAETRAMHMEHLLMRNPKDLSRGEEQLVQIARTMVRAPRLLLLDEPFAPLDAHLRITMRAEIGLLQRGYGVTTVMATNDPDDVAALATHVLVLSRSSGDDGVPFTVVQTGTPREVAADPVSLDVAAAVATVWTTRARVETDGIGYWLVIEDAPASRIRAWSPALADHRGRTVVLGFRHGDLVVSERGEVQAEVDRIVPGAAEALLCRVGSRPVQAASGARPPTSFERGDTVRLQVLHSLVFDMRSGARIA